MADPFTLTAGAALGGEALGISTGTLAGIGTGASILGGITSAVGKVFGGESSANMYKYQSGVAMLNRQINLQNADYSRHVGEIEAQRVGMKGRQDVANTKVIQSGRGLDVNTGSAAATRDSIQELSQHDQATTRSNAERRAYGFDVEASKNLAQAGMYDAAGRNAKTAGMIEAGGSLLSTAGAVSDKWLKAAQVGIGGGRGIELAPSPDFPSEAWSG